MPNQLIHLRLPDREHEELRTTARENGRTMQEEIRHRLRLPPAKPTDFAEQIAKRDREIDRLNGVVQGLTLAISHMKARP